jgi:hypothetical protein
VAAGVVVRQPHQLPLVVAAAGSWVLALLVLGAHQISLDALALLLAAAASASASAATVCTITVAVAAVGLQAHPILMAALGVKAYGAAAAAVGALRGPELTEQAERLLLQAQAVRVRRQALQGPPPAAAAVAAARATQALVLTAKSSSQCFRRRESKHGRWKQSPRCSSLGNHQQHNKHLRELFCVGRRNTLVASARILRSCHWRQRRVDMVVLRPSHANMVAAT